MGTICDLFLKIVAWFLLHYSLAFENTNQQRPINMESSQTMMRIVKNLFLVGIILLLMSAGSFAAYADFTDLSPVSESAIMLLFGAGLVGLAEVCRKWFRKKSPKPQQCGGALCSASRHG
jgi:hypothetical protein